MFTPAAGTVTESTNEPLQARVKHEVDNYLREPSTSMCISPFQWWRLNSSRYPLLCKLAQYVLVIQSTSVSSERVFSTAGDVVSAKRSSLSPELVDKLVFLNKNHKLM